MRVPRFVISTAAMTAVALSLSCGPASSEPSPSPSVSASSTKGVAMTIRGEVIEGVEAGCMLLRTDDSTLYLLLGGDAALIRSGARLEVEGEARPDVVTTCQQGIPFNVSHMRRI